LEATEDSVLTALWPGVVSKASADFVATRRGGVEAMRTGTLEALARGEWLLDAWIWQNNAFVNAHARGRWFTIGRLFGPDGALRCWYVNFERPPVWHRSGWDTFDLFVDLVVEPDGRWRWKDEDEYAHGRRLGLVDDAEHRAVQAAREEALALVEARAGLFGESGAGAWRPEPDWPLPALP
jgi:predicted RNA-binding protein associated with RNAse of E/G family